MPALPKISSEDFSYLDEVSMQSLYLLGQDQKMIRLSVEGMHCAKCVRKIESLSNQIQGVTTARVDMSKNLVQIEFDPTKVNPSEILTSISKLGFSVRALPSHSKDDSEIIQQDRHSLIRLAVAAACASNIMGFAFPIYLGSEGVWLSLFSWLSFIAYLPVVTYVAWPFYCGAWQSLKAKQLSIDLPIALASMAGFVFSTAQLLQGGQDFYFDSMSGFLFLILLARFFQNRLQRRYLNISLPFENLDRVRLLSANTWHWHRTQDLKLGDQFELHANETLPVEAQLQSPQAYFSLAWLTGESLPRLFMAGATVPAGSRLLEGPAQLSFRQPLSQTAFGKTLDEIRQFSLSRNRLVTLADRMTQWLLITVFALAAVFMIFYWPVSSSEAVRRALALIVVACPCAMAFGTPLALSIALKKANQAGLLVSDANVFESVNRIQNIFVDKTGTITDLDLSLATEQNEAAPVPPVYRKIILALENHSLHPIAFAFRQSFREQGKLPPVGNFKETPGIGVSGYIFGKLYSLQSHPQLNDELPSCTLFEDDRALFHFKFATKIKPGAEDTLHALRAKGYRVQMLSGDQVATTKALAEKLGFAIQDVHAHLTPEQKADLVQAAAPAMMIGDGLNDARAMMKSAAGIAVAGAVGPALKSAQVYIRNQNLTSLLELLNIAQHSSQLIKQNLTISVVYNVLGATLALTGHLNPLVAAILMPISSSLILLNSWRWGR